MRKAMVETAHPQLSVRKQCELLDVNRNRLKTKERKGWNPNPECKKALDITEEIHSKDPTMGARQVGLVLARNGFEFGRWTVGKMMEFLGLKAIYCRPRTTIPAPHHPKYPYLLRDLTINEPDEVWAIDITYIPWKRGHVYLTAIIDWKTRAVLAWRLSNTMETDFCLDALCEAIGKEGMVPKIINTDQGSQFTGVEWLSAVESLGSKVSMDGRGRWQDNVMIERFWRSLKHEWVLLHEYWTLQGLENLLGEWIESYNYWRPHTANGGKTPMEAYRGVAPELEVDARAFVENSASASISKKAHKAA